MGIFSDVFDNLTKGGSLGGLIGAVYSHNGTEDTNPFRTGDSKKKIHAVVGAMAGAAVGQLIADEQIGDNTYKAIVTGSVSAIISGLLTGQIGEDKFIKPALVIGSTSTLGALLYYDREEEEVKEKEAEEGAEEKKGA
jgi:hypothetical protein